MFHLQAAWNVSTHIERLRTSEGMILILHIAVWVSNENLIAQWGYKNFIYQVSLSVWFEVWKSHRCDIGLVHLSLPSFKFACHSLMSIHVYASLVITWGYLFLFRYFVARVLDNNDGWIWLKFHRRWPWWWETLDSERPFDGGESWIIVLKKIFNMTPTRSEFDTFIFFMKS